MPRGYAHSSCGSQCYRQIGERLPQRRLGGFPTRAWLSFGTRSDSSPKPWENMTAEALCGITSLCTERARSGIRSLPVRCLRMALLFE